MVILRSIFTAIKFIAIKFQENIPPKGVIFSDFMLIFAMSLMIFACLDLQH